MTLNRVPQNREALWVALAGTFLVLFTYTVPLGALEPMFSALSAGASGRAWMVSSMSVGLSAALLASGSVADAYGRRKVFIAGAFLLALASVAAAFAHTPLLLVLARVFQGVGGAALTSCSLGILGHLFPQPAERTRATALWGASLGAGIAVGPLASAALEGLFNWRAGQGLCAALGIVVAFSAVRMLPESRAASPGKIDLLGTGLLVVGLTGLLGGLVEARNGWAQSTTVLMLIVGGVSLAGFIWSQATRSTRLLDLRLFRRADFVAATLGALATGLGIISIVTFIPVLMLRGLGQSLVLSAAITLAWSVGSVVSAAATRKLPERFTPRHRLVASLLGVALGQVALGGVALDSSPWRLFPGLLFAGLSSGVLNATLARQAVASVPSGSAAVGSGANNTARYVGAAFGMTVVAMLVGHAAPTEVVPRWNVAANVTAAFSVVGALAVFLCRWRSAEAPQKTREAMAFEP